MSGVLTQISTQNGIHSWTHARLAGRVATSPLPAVALGVSTIVISICVPPIGATGLTVIAAVSVAALKAVAPPPTEASAVWPLKPWVWSQARNVRPGSTVPCQSAAGTKRMRVPASEPSRRAVAAVGVPNASHVRPLLSVYCHVPCALSTAVTAMPSNAPQSTSVIRSPPALATMSRTSVPGLVTSFSSIAASVIDARVVQHRGVVHRGDRDAERVLGEQAQRIGGPDADVGDPVGVGGVVQDQVLAADGGRQQAGRAMQSGRGGQVAQHAAGDLGGVDVVDVARGLDRVGRLVIVGVGPHVVFDDQRRIDAGLLERMMVAGADRARIHGGQAAAVAGERRGQGRLDRAGAVRSRRTAPCRGRRRPGCRRSCPG